MSPRVLDVRWAEGASPEAMVEAFGEAALTVAVPAALLDDSVMRGTADAALRTATLTR